MILQSEREQVVAHCRHMGALRLTPGTSGNISLINAERGFMAISPSSMSYEAMTAADVVVMNLDAELVDGARRPSTEYAMHLACYRARPDIGAVVHTHSPAATTLATLGWELPAIHYMIAYSGVSLVRCAPYHLFGTVGLADAATECLGRGYACLLESHGVLATGPDIGRAFALAEQLEFCADLYLRAQSVGTPKILSDDQIQQVIARFSSYSVQ